MALDLLKFDKDLYYLVRHGIEGKRYRQVASEGFWKPGAEMSSNPYGNGFSWGFKTFYV